MKNYRKAIVAVFNILRRYLCFAAADVILGDGTSLLQPSTKTEYILAGLAIFVSGIIEYEYWKARESDRGSSLLEVPKNLKQKIIFSIWVLMKVLYNYLIIGALQIIFLKNDSFLKPDIKGEYFTVCIIILCFFIITYFYQRKKRDMV
ncbi:hypothetical protein [Faecalimonas sp.]